MMKVNLDSDYKEFDVSLLEDGVREINVLFDTDLNDFNVEFRSGSGTDAEYYNGAYEVTPLAYDEQMLETKDKILTDDVTVHKVPYYETTNINGTTVYIAEA